MTLPFRSRGCVWGWLSATPMGMVQAYWGVEEPPAVQHLAQQIAEAMGRPLNHFFDRSRTRYIRERPQWSEPVPRLRQVGILVVYQNKLPKCDDAFGDLYEEVEEHIRGKHRGQHRKEFAMVQESKSPVKLHDSREKDNVRIYTLEVLLLSGPITKKFAKKNPTISRTIEIRGDQTLEDLHDAIFDAFDRWDEHMYEFQFGNGPMDPKARTYMLPDAFGMHMGGETRCAGRVDRTRLDSLGLEVGCSFSYLFDFGDEWWHQIEVKAIEEKAPIGRYPKVAKKVGQSPPQYWDA